MPLEFDVRNYGSIKKMADAAEDACGAVSILVNNAGCNVRKPALDVSWDDWNTILETNLRGTFFVAQRRQTTSLHLDVAAPRPDHAQDGLVPGARRETTVMLAPAIRNALRFIGFP